MDNEAGFALGLIGLMVLIWGIAMLVILVVAVIVIIAKWKLFEKAGEPGWTAIIPIYNLLQFSKIATGDFHIGIVWLIAMGVNTVCVTIQTVFNGLATAGDGSLWFLSLIGLVFSLIGMVAALGGAVVGGYLNYVFTKSYGQTDLMCILSIFFTPIIFLIMAFSKDTQYIGPQGHLRLWGKK
jgi:hypothetical protein